MNVIVIVIDTLRRDHIGVYGNKWVKTPNFDRFAAESAVFTRATGESLPTIPHRRSIHTGMRTFPFRKSYYDEGRSLDISSLHLGKGAQVPAGALRGGRFLGVPGIVMPGWEPIPSDQITIAELLQVYGYDTGLITSTSPYWIRPMSMVDMNYQRGFRHWDFIRGGEGDNSIVSSRDKGLLDVDKYVPPAMRGGWEHMALERMAGFVSRWEGEEDYLNAQVWRRAANWVEGNYGQERPFLLWVDCFEPHEPFLVPREYADMYDSPDYAGREPVQPKYGPIDYLTERELRRMQTLYAANVTFVDKWFGIFIDRVRSLGLLDETLVVLTSDHGVQLGEHGVTGKMPQRMWKDLHDVPFMIRHPQGLGAGQRFDAFVQGQDTFPTVLSHLDIPLPYDVDGKDLWPVIRGEKTKVRDYMTCGFNLNVRAVDDGYSLIALRDGEQPQLRNLRDDPQEQANIAKDNPKIVKRMYDCIMEDAGGAILPDWEKVGGSTDFWPLSDDVSDIGRPISMDQTAA